MKLLQKLNLKKDEKGIVLLMAIMFIAVISAFMTGIIVRQSSQWITTRYLTRAYQKQDCMNFVSELLQAIVNVNAYNFSVTLRVPGMVVYSGHTGIPGPISVGGDIGGLSGSGRTVEVIGGNIVPVMGSSANFEVLLTPVFTCEVVDTSGNPQFTEVEMAVNFEAGGF